MTQESSAGDGPPVCPRHPDRISYIRCQRCRRPVCTQCQQPAAVGVHCADCRAEAAERVRTPTTVIGAPVTPGRPIATLVIIMVTAAFFLLQYIPGLDLTRHLALIPGYVLTEPWRLLTVALVHSTLNPLHLGFNMLALWYFGQYLEPLLGRWRFVLAYLVTALGGSTMIMVIAALSGDLLVATVGASGAIFGLFGIALCLQLRSRGNATPMVILISLNLLLGFFIPQVSWAGHIGGLLAGILIGGALIWAPRQHRGLVQYGAISGLALVQLLIVYLSFALQG